MAGPGAPDAGVGTQDGHCGGALGGCVSGGRHTLVHAPACDAASAAGNFAPHRRCAGHPPRHQCQLQRPAQRPGPVWGRGCLRDCRWAISVAVVAGLSIIPGIALLRVVCAPMLPRRRERFTTKEVAALCYAQTSVAVRAGQAGGQTCSRARRSQARCACGVQARFAQVACCCRLARRRAGE
jgi:hypothetical protein